MKKFLTFLLILLSQSILSQKEYNNWYFGNGAGITFNSGSPVPLNGGQLNTIEACASISDSNGNLLFYMQGDKIYNRDHVLMMNGDNLLGSFSSTHTQIVPFPGNSSLYYAFTTDALENNLANGLRYSLINMDMDGGRGAVTSKNNLLLIKSTEKVTVARHSNGHDYWVVGHSWEDNRFQSYLVNSSGLNISPVISQIGIRRS